MLLLSPHQIRCLFALLLIVVILHHFWGPFAAAEPHQKILHLTDADKEQFNVSYNALDQCQKREMGQSQINSFALKFSFFDKRRRKCANGLLICYPGALDINVTNYAYGMAPNVQFRVGNHPGNDVAKACAERQRRNCQRDEKIKQMFCERGGIAWHGIRVSSRHNQSVNGCHLLLELSITNKTYQFELARNAFTIKFGNRHNLLTQLVDENDRSIELSAGTENDSLRDAFLTAKTTKAVALAKYVGLWMLGLDFLPMNIRDTMHLKVYRECDCNLQAWFLRPNDNPKMVLLEMFSRVPIHCPVSANKSLDVVQDKLAQGAECEDETIDIEQCPISGKTLLVQFQLNEKPREVVIELKNTTGHQILTLKIIGQQIELTGPRIELNSTKQKSKETTSNFELKEAKEVNKSQSFLSRNSGKFVQVEFVVYAFFYEIRLNGVKQKRFTPWQNDWLRYPNRTADVTTVTLIGDLYPNSAQSFLVDDHRKRIPTQEAHSHTLLPLNVNDRVVFRGQVNQDAKSMTFYLIHDGHQINEYIGIALLIIQFEWSDGQARFGTFYQEWDEKQKRNVIQNLDNQSKKRLNDGIGTDLKRGMPFELHCVLREQKDEKHEKSRHEFGPNLVMYSKPMRVNVTWVTAIGNSTIHLLLGVFQLKAALPINNFGANGDLDLFKHPTVKRYKKKERNRQLKNIILHPLDPLLAVGDSIHLKGKLKENATMLRILFLHKMPEPIINKTNIPLEIFFEFDKNYHANFMFLRFNVSEDYYCQNNADKFDDTNDALLPFQSRLFSGEEFKIEIRVEPEKYRIFVHRAFAESFAHRFPPWAVNYIRVDGDVVEEVKVNFTRGATVTTDPHKLAEGATQLPIVFRVADERPFGPNDSIYINSETAEMNKMGGSKLSIAVSLLYEALETYETVSYSIRKAKLCQIGKVVLHLRLNNTHLLLYEQLYKNEFIHRSFSMPLHNNRIRPEQPFNLKITFGQGNRLSLQLNGSHLIDMHNRTTLPHWAIQYVRIEGDLSEPKTKVIFRLRNNTNDEQNNE